MKHIKREIVGEREVTEEWIRKKWAHKNSVNQIVFRRIEQHVVLSCGHTLSKGTFSVIPKRTVCYRCTEALENEAQSALYNGDTAPHQVQGGEECVIC
jgi:hypothetical protein